LSVRHEGTSTVEMVFSKCSRENFKKDGLTKVLKAG